MSLESLGGEIVCDVSNAREMPRYVQARKRLVVSDAVKGCRNCKLVEGCRRPVPFSGPMRADFAVVGEAPGREEDARGVPFVGPSGKLLRAVMAKSGINDKAVFWCNTTSCWPTQDGKGRAPGKTEMQACRVNLMDQLDVANVRAVLLVGATALSAFRSDLKLSQVRAQVFTWKNRWLVAATYHPAAVLRDRSLMKALQEDMDWWQKNQGRLQWEVGLKCVRCGQDAVKWDRDSVAYCKKHWDQWGLKVWRSEQKKWREEATNQTSIWDFADPIEW